jgi:Fic family protein
VQEVYNYVRAMNYGMERLATLPLSLRFVREIHERLMDGVRGLHATPGEFRKLQNWIGGGGERKHSVYTPPPAPELINALSRLEQYLHAECAHPPLVRIGLIHYQIRDAVDRAKRFQDLQIEWRERLTASGASGRLLLLSDKLFEAPEITIGQAQEWLSITHPGAQKNVAKLVVEGILKPAGEALRGKGLLQRLYWRFWRMVIKLFGL